MRWKMQVALGALAAAVLVQAGCLVVEPEDEVRGCETFTYQKCETFCDPHNCWQECWEREVTRDDCSSPGRDAPGGSCQSDRDCAGGLVCLSGTCGGHGGLCQTCETSLDCAGASARCVSLNEPGGDAKVCSRICEANRDCPADFQCVRSGDSSAGHCLPERNSNGTRSCDSIPNGECTSAGDCADGERCVRNECVPPENAECSGDEECSAGEVCRDFECVADDQPDCLSRSDCRSDEICIDGSCESRNPEGEGCVFNEECDEGALCVDGRCLSRCENRSDCNNREFCREGLCREVECRTNPDCPTGQICVEASCVDACDRASDCGDGFECSDNGFCEPDPDVECRSNAECARDEMCNDGQCVAPCTCNQQCPEGEVCNMEDGLCEDPSDTASPDCENDCGCPSGQTCSDGTCE